MALLALFALVALIALVALLALLALMSGGLGSPDGPSDPVALLAVHFQFFNPSNSIIQKLYCLAIASTKLCELVSCSSERFVFPLYLH